MIARVYCNGTRAKCLREIELTAGMAGAPIAFEFSPEWDGLTKVAVFTSDGTKDRILDESGETTVPHEILATPGMDVTVAVFARREDGTTWPSPSLVCKIGCVKFGADPSGDESYPPTPSVGEQAVALAGAAKEIAVEIERRANAGEFNGAQGQQGPQGLPGKDGSVKFEELTAEQKGELKGDPGGYYTPLVSQVDENTMKVSFAASNERMEAIPEKNITLPAGKTPIKGKDYWTPADKKEVADEAAATLTAAVGIVNPDMYTGTDSEKLQAAFDALATSGGIISINRVYTLTDHIYVWHNSSSHNNLITVAGDGKQAGIDFGSYCFQGADTSTRSYGGVIFKDLWLTGTAIGFDCTHLIRLTFDKCMIRNFKNFLYCTDCLQSIYIMGCYIRASSSGIADGSVKETINATTVADLKIFGCVAEQGYRLLDVTGQMDGCTITASCVEGYKGVPIVLPPVCKAVNISSNYFEDNAGTNIDARATTTEASLSIVDNLFTEWRTDEYVDGSDPQVSYRDAGVILLPTHISYGTMIVTGNRGHQDGIFLRVPDDATDLSRLFVFGNVGKKYDPNNLVKMLMPNDLNNIDVDLEMGVDYWTAEDRAKAVNEVIALANGSESWVFTLADGSTIERVVLVGGGSAAYTSETWTFTLDDGSTITKVVSIA